jgi:hypothetical protein
MGICLALHSVSDENIEKILKTPPLIWRLIGADDPGMYLEAIRENTKSGFLAWLLNKQPDIDSIEVPDLTFVEGENIGDDLDKAWHGIHYCLNKTEYDAEAPLDFITAGGESAGEVDVGYGPARLFDGKTVKEIEKRISHITTERLRENYSPSEMNKMDIYPNIWEREGDEGFEYIASYFETLQEFISGCSRHGLGMAVYFS